MEPPVDEKRPPPRGLVNLEDTGVFNPFVNQTNEMTGTEWIKVGALVFGKGQG